MTSDAAPFALSQAPAQSPSPRLSTMPEMCPERPGNASSAASATPVEKSRTAVSAVDQAVPHASETVAPIPSMPCTRSGNRVSTRLLRPAPRSSANCTAPLHAELKSPESADDRTPQPSARSVSNVTSPWPAASPSTPTRSPAPWKRSEMRPFTPSALSSRLPKSSPSAGRSVSLKVSITGARLSPSDDLTASNASAAGERSSFSKKSARGGPATSAMSLKPALTSSMPAAASLPIWKSPVRAPSARPDRSSEAGPATGSSAEKAPARFVPTPSAASLTAPTKLSKSGDTSSQNSPTFVAAVSNAPPTPVPTCSTRGASLSTRPSVCSETVPVFVPNSSNTSYVWSVPHTRSASLPVSVPTAGTSVSVATWAAPLSAGLTASYRSSCRPSSAESRAFMSPASVSFMVCAMSPAAPPAPRRASSKSAAVPMPAARSRFNPFVESAVNTWPSAAARWASVIPSVALSTSRRTSVRSLALPSAL